MRVGFGRGTTLGRRFVLLGFEWTMRRPWLRLQLSCDVVQCRGDVRAEELQRRNRDDRDQREDQGVLDECLTLLALHVETRGESPNHVLEVEPHMLFTPFCT